MSNEVNVAESPTGATKTTDQDADTPGRKPWVGWLMFAIAAVIWLVVLLTIFTSRVTLTTQHEGETQCYSLADKLMVNFSNANVASNMKSGDDAESEKYQYGDYRGADIDDAFRRHNIALMQDRSCEAQRANDAAKLNLIGTVGATTLICWALIATRRRGIQPQSTT